jgi:pimeloyl-ACP methyl ester carboxylesterase
VSGVVKSVAGPVVLVGHSYGGAVITDPANGNANVKSLVYVAAFASDTGESALELTGKFPGSTLPPTLASPVEVNGASHMVMVSHPKDVAGLIEEAARVQ